MPTNISKKMYKAGLEFIDDIPNDKPLGGWSGDPHNIAYGINYRLDMQKMAGGNEYWDIHVQCNKGKM